jgi:tRNA(Arg) A34 adenosine deaminase TadA
MIGRLPVHLPESECPTVEKLLIKLADGPDSAKAALTLLDAAATTLGMGRVGAALIAHTPAGVEVLRVAFNLPDVSHLLHAEYLLLRSALAAGTLDFFHPGTPSVTLISTRKPCRMCAAIILDVMGHNCQKVLYRHFDYGPMAARTVLNSNSFDRSLMPFIQGEREEQLDETL